MTFLSPKVKGSLLVFALLMPSFAVASDAPPPSSSDWIPAGVEQLGRTAAFHTDFTFDRTMLQMASGLIDDGDADIRNAIAKLNGVTVHLYRYAQPGMYDARQLDVIRQQYKGVGWKHLVSTQSHAAPPTAPGPYAVGTEGHTDLFIKFQGADVTGMVVMQASPRNLNVVALTGDLSPLDLLHLRGHFGIPKFAGDGFAPADN
jgi:Domain of unknown function (DUF4252)